jgi:hypothetical protein
MVIQNNKYMQQGVKTQYYSISFGFNFFVLYKLGFNIHYKFHTLDIHYIIMVL